MAKAEYTTFSEGGSAAKEARRREIGEELVPSFTQRLTRQMQTGRRPNMGQYGLEAGRRETPYLTEDDYTEATQGRELPEDIGVNDAGQRFYRKDGALVPEQRRPSVLPLTRDPETGGLALAMPKVLDVVGEMLPGLGSASVPMRAGEIALGSGPLRKLAAPAIRKADAPLFDYSKLDQVPNVPQFDLPRYNPKNGVSDRVGDLVNDTKTIRKLEGIFDKGVMMGGKKWYNNEPLREEFVQELGLDQGNKDFGLYMDYVSGSSPRSRVPANVNNGSFYYYLDKQGLPLPEKNPAPYGHMAQKNHRTNAETIRNGGWDLMTNPKPPSFKENLTGNQLPGTIDAHAFKLPAMLSEDPRFLAGSDRTVDKNKVATTLYPKRMFESGELSMKDALKRPQFWEGAPNKNEYGAMEGMYQDIARRKGLSTAQGQASGWIGGGDITDLGSSADPFLGVFEQKIRSTADKTGMQPRDVLRQFIRGQMTLKKKGGAVRLPPGGRAR